MLYGTTTDWVAVSDLLMLVLTVLATIIIFQRVVKAMARVITDGPSIAFLLMDVSYILVPLSFILPYYLPNREYYDLRVFIISVMAMSGSLLFAHIIFALETGEGACGLLAEYESEQ